jgi:TolB-like protein
LKFRFINIAFSAAVFLFSGTAAYSESAAFGFFVNESGNESFNYLEKILPNSFAGTLKNKHNFSIIKPAQIPSLTFEEDNNFKNELRERDLKSITDNISADYFIYGTFKSLDNNRILLKVNVYKKGTSSVFYFEEIGYLETEVFKLVDNIAMQISNIASESAIYKNEKITPKSKLSVLTNIDGADLNSLYFEFMKGGYRLSATQGNSIYGLIDDEQINSFFHISGINASFHRIHDPKEIELMYGTWSGADYYKSITDQKNTYDKHVFNYIKTKNEVLQKFRESGTDNSDYLIIIGFDSSRTTAWVRCINVKNNKLIITESGIRGSSVPEITKNIISSLTTGLPGTK